MLMPLSRKLLLDLSQLFQTNTSGSFISTMETETIASRNVVDLLLTESFGTGICAATAPVEGEAQAEELADFVLGWDC